MKKVFIGGYIATLFALFLYSYTQIDLSLTFSRIDFLRELVKSFQYIGYFNRPLSTFIFVLLTVLLLNFYLGFLLLARTKQIETKTIWKLIFFSAIILGLSYNAFSYDLFNYMFDAKIITHYHLNPYEHKALDFAGDPMLSFMRWTHRVYPYGPVWLGLTVPLSYLGFNLFIPTFFLFKTLMAASFIGATYYIGKIVEKISPQHMNWAIVFFALNPLVLIESLVSAHLDIVMIFFASWSLYRLVNKKYVSSAILLAISAGIKFITATLLPVYLWIAFLQMKKKKINWDLVFLSALVLMIAGAWYASSISTFQPWYLLEMLFIASFISFRYYIFIPTVIISFFAMYTYAPYLYLGNWDKPVPQVLANIYMFSYILSILAVGFYFVFKKQLKSKNLKVKSTRQYGGQATQE